MKKILMLTVMMAMLLMAACAQADGESDKEQDNQEENQTTTSEAPDQEDEQETNSDESEGEQSAPAEEMDVDTYLNENYKLDQTHYETDVWESESGTVNYTVKLLPDNEAYGQKIDEMFQDSSKSYDETQTMLDTAEQIMAELPEFKENTRVDSVSWVSYDGEFSVTLIQDFENSEAPADGEKLSDFTSEQIEYARVWLQLGPNQQLDELNVWHIPAGEKLNEDDETSAVYPEDVIQLAGGRLVDGSVTYSGNGDGTINVYNVPLRWDGQYPAGEEFYNEIIENTKLVSIDTGDDQEVIRLIKLMKIH
ncbi:hypothetical protein [Thalassobacillus hwangdonensis]|uniref:Lipoprotein n=1 Tax=Thalassobacillus hwangdonensis TaxID=546108 RepID=A0ABW3L2K5_9BACI